VIIGRMFNPEYHCGGAIQPRMLSGLTDSSLPSAVQCFFRRQKKSAGSRVARSLFFVFRARDQIFDGVECQWIFQCAEIASIAALSSGENCPAQNLF
jgi:hypothetical protein